MLRLKKNLYLKQAGRNWNHLIHSTLTEASFVCIDEDACVLLRVFNTLYFYCMWMIIICSAFSKDVLSLIYAPYSNS